MKMNRENSNSHFLLIGSGRLAKHLEFYFSQLGFSFSTWNRRQDIKTLENLSSPATHVLLAISDSALQGFVNEHFKNSNKVIVSFSGALSIDGAVTAHPLMSFGPQLYTLNEYEKIHFVLTGVRSLEEALPGLKNQHSVLSAENKSLYHALCVLGGNFPVLLWNQMAEGFKKLGLPAETHKFYIEKVTENFNRLGSQALTGPLVRKDLETIQKNLKALENSPYRNVYAAFVEAYK
jgi:2-dehydropantoate 2-reductase